MGEGRKGRADQGLTFTVPIGPTLDHPAAPAYRSRVVRHTGQTGAG
jgi:hypothetical protein